jgi:hypothetical protein
MAMVWASRATAYSDRYFRKAAYAGVGRPGRDLSKMARLASRALSRSAITW